MYFGILVLARVVISLALTLINKPIILDLPPIPIDAFNLCGVIMDLKLMVIPNSIGTLTGT